MNELLRPIRDDHRGSSAAGSLFTDEEEASPQLVTVSSGPYAEHLPVGNLSVGEIRRRFRDRLDIDPRSVAVIDGHDASDDVVVTAGQVLTFMHRAGEKGIVAAGVPPAVEGGILPPGLSSRLTMRAAISNLRSAGRDARLYGRRDACGQGAGRLRP